MNRINILDCTLRDGGYVNSFNFGRTAIKSIISKLAAAHIDIIECGFLKSGASDPDRSLFPSAAAVADYISERSSKTMYVAMIAYGDISIDEIEDFDGKSIDGIRLTFHLNEVDEAIKFGNALKKKGYAVFMQPVGTMAYSDEELISLIGRINEMEPFAFYIVDTLGTMYSRDLMRIFCIYDHNLNSDIMVGFHSHNNLQLSFANSIELMRMDTKRRIIIDSSVNGMGRAAGNLCTEICTDYINNNIAARYDIIELLEIVDDYLNDIFNRMPWGYSVPYFISAIHSCHPNYSSYLLNKQTLSVKGINAILKDLDKEKRFIFDKDYIEQQYLFFQQHNIDDSSARNELAELVKNKKIVILAPGMSVYENRKNIEEFLKNNSCFVISVNFIPEGFDINAIFVSNMRRLKNIESVRSLKEKGIYVILTSNISADNEQGVIVMNYSDYINRDHRISDNAGLMLLNLLNKIGTTQVELAGFDGFGTNPHDKGYNFMNADTDRDIVLKNQAISERLNVLDYSMKINFLTNSEYRRDNEV